jgi:hypothetical protein
MIRVPADGPTTGETTRLGCVDREESPLTWQTAGDSKMLRVPVSLDGTVATCAWHEEWSALSTDLDLVPPSVQARV